MVDPSWAIARGRAAAALLIGDGDTCIIRRRGDRRHLDPDTMEYVDTWTTVYGGDEGGPCRIKVVATQSRDPAGGGREFIVVDALVQVPVAAGEYRDDDVVEVMSSKHDPAIVGAKLSVIYRELKTHATMRRLHVAEVV